ncbi:MAG: IS1595 family transposase [Planctomycetes bacterium]|nr:IS1595 family transposase [Planctomycetota bacterium]
MTRPDFPKTIFEFQKRFSTEEACLEYLIQSRWPDGFICPKCGHYEYFWKAQRKLLQCKSCGHQTSATAGTIMHRTKQPLTLWFYAAYLVTTHTPGMSAVQFQRQTGINNYQTAFTMLHKLRAGMVSQGRGRINGVIQVDETYIGGAQPGLRGRGASGKVIVVGAAEIRGNRLFRIRLKIIPNVNSQTLNGFVKDNVVEGSTVITDDWKGYNYLQSAGYNRVIDDSALGNIHKVFSNLKMWLIGTHHGVSPQHLQAYLNEYTFRFNRRVTPMAAFQTVLGLGTQRLGPTYEGLYGIAKHSKLAWVHPNPKKKVI